MTYQFHPPSPTPLKSTVLVLTGGALGVGASIVRHAHTAGAHVFFGDVLDSEGHALAKELSSSSSSSDGGPKVHYQHCDVTSYADTLSLFDAAFNACGRVDHAIANAGIGEQGNIFDEGLDLESVKDEPKRAMGVVDVNLKGEIYFARIASVYLRQGDGGGDKSLTLVSSVAGFREDPGLFVYTPSKHGVLGLMRSLRDTLIHYKPHPIRTNAISPWMTKTRLTAAIEPVWEQNHLPANTAEDVARVVIGVLSEGKVNGATMYIEGGRAWNVEAGLMDLRPKWIGEKQAADLDKGTALMGGGEHWTAGQKK